MDEQTCEQKIALLWAMLYQDRSDDAMWLAYSYTEEAERQAALGYLEEEEK